MGWFMSADVPQKSMSLEREKQGKNFRYLWISFPQHKSFHPQYQQISLIQRISGPVTGYFHILPCAHPYFCRVDSSLLKPNRGQWQEEKKRAIWNATDFWRLAISSRNRTEWWAMLWSKQSFFFFTPMDSIHFNEFTHCLIVLSRKDPLKRRILLNRVEI